MGKKQWNKYRNKSGHKSHTKSSKFSKSKPKQFQQKSKVFGNKNADSERVGVCPSLIEKDIAVTEYISTTNGFTGIIKERFSDFQVNEIDFDGNEVKLTDLTIPEQPKVENVFNESEPEVIKIITADVWNEINDLATSSVKTDKTIEINVHDLTKDQRSLIHRTVKKTHGSSLIGSTIDRDQCKFIQFKKFQKFNKNDQRTQWLWPHEYTYFILHKTNVDTLKATAELAKKLNMNASRITYAGTKDKRGKTTQWCCLRKMQPDRISMAAKGLPMIRVGNFTFKPQPLKLGSLKGNRFRIALRGVTAAAETIEAAMSTFRDKGFINYYGLQRFGNNATIPTHKVGLALIQGSFKEACELILMPREGDPAFMAAVRENWWKHRIAKNALNLLHKNNKNVEAKLLVGLSKHGPNDYVNALENIPRNMRLLYIHAYQSLIWNEIVTRRIKEFGLKIQIGDLVYVNQNEADNCKSNEILLDDINDELSGDENDENEDALKIDEETISPFKTIVKPLNEEDLNSGLYSIFDIVLPLPGHDITYPTNEVGKWYEERLAKDNLSSAKLKLKQKTYSLCGAYRKMVIKPENVSWAIRKYNTVTEDLIRSDIEELLNENHLPQSDDGIYKALIIDVSLPSSCYATMALREILKVDTSKAIQRQLNHPQEKSDNSNDASSDDKSKPEKRKADAQEESDTDDKDNLKKIKTI